MTGFTSENMNEEIAYIGGFSFKASIRRFKGQVRVEVGVYHREAIRFPNRYIDMVYDTMPENVTDAEIVEKLNQFRGLLIDNLGNACKAHLAAEQKAMRNEQIMLAVICKNPNLLPDDIIRKPVASL